MTAGRLTPAGFYLRTELKNAPAEGARAGAKAQMGNLPHQRQVSRLASVRPASN